MNEKVSVIVTYYIPFKSSWKGECNETESNNSTDPLTIDETEEPDNATVEVVIVEPESTTLQVISEEPENTTLEVIEEEPENVTIQAKTTQF